MNHRIRELANQATKYADDNAQQWNWNPGPSWDELFEVKFAELIVQDCVTKCAMMGMANWDNDDISWAVEGCIDNIRAHFGVSE